MGSLFTRAFISFWVTIVFFALAAAAITAVNFHEDAAEPQRLAKQLQAVLTEGGEEGLKAWLVAANEQDPTQQILVIDAAGHELLGRHVPGMLQLRPLVGNRSMMAPPPGLPRTDSREEEGRPPAFGQERPPMGAVGALPDLPIFPRITGRDGTTYTVLLDPPPHRGLFSPPFSLLAKTILMLLALAISGLVSYGFARSIIRPLELLQGTAKQLAAGRLETRTAPSVGRRQDEIGMLAREIDAMAGRLAAMVEARQHLLRDMSHELRSPLARLQMAVGLARQSGTDGEAQLARIEREGERLEQLIARILEYARLERDTSTLAREVVDVSDLVRRVVLDAEFEAQASPGRISLALDAGAGGPAGCLSNADPAVLHTAIDNVVRNALVHGGDGPIQVGVSAIGGEIAIEVSDRGPGVSPRDLTRIFEPFFRVASDEPGRPVNGYGIGLALAVKAVQLHGGRVEAVNAEGGGLRVRIVLPSDRGQPVAQ
jgi:two-component system, OmpR family, sensor kinase